MALVLGFRDCPEWCLSLILDLGLIANFVPKGSWGFWSQKDHCRREKNVAVKQHALFDLFTLWLQSLPTGGRLRKTIDRENTSFACENPCGHENMVEIWP